MKWNRVREMGVCMAITSTLGAGPAMAQFVLDIEVEPPDAGVVATFPSGNEFEEGEFITITATPADGFEFAGWEGNITASESSMTFEMTDDTILTAVFVEAPATQYTLTAFVEPSGAGTLVREPADFTYEEGAEVRVTAFAGDGFVFAGWTGDLADDADPNDPVLTLAMDDDLDVRATFAAAQELTGDSQAAGSAPCGVLGMFSLGLMFSMMFVMKLGCTTR